MKSFNHTVISFGRNMAAAAALAVALVAPSHAAGPVLGPGDSLPLSGPTNFTSPPPVPRTFLDLYPFMLSVTSSLDYFTNRIEFPPPFSITSFTATLFSGATPIASGVDAPQVGALIPNSFFIGSLAPGAYELRISGVSNGSSGSDTYSGLLRVAGPVAPIPEPEIWAMMLVGAGLIGMRLRKKSRVDGALRFA
jgi:hypothetical protein